MDEGKIRTMSLDQYPFQSSDKVRYCDTDRQGHVNNAVFNQYLETGRVELLYHPDHPLYGPDCSFVVASSKVDYLKEIRWPGMVHIGTGVTRIGNSSIHVAQTLYQDNVVVGIGETVIVQVAGKTGQSHPLTAETKETLKKYLLLE